MISVTPASRYVTAWSHYQSRSSMDIRGLLPRDSTELAEVFPIVRTGGGHYDDHLGKRTPDIEQYLPIGGIYIKY